MSLQEDLKARMVQLISQQMASWVVAIQRDIGERQAQLVRSLDELQEMVARYDEQFDEGEVERAVSEGLAGASGGGGESLTQIKASLVEIEKGANLSEVLTHLVNEAARYVERVAIFILKGPNAIGWYGHGFPNPDAVKQTTIPLNSDTIFRNISHGRGGLRGHISHSPGTAQALARLGGSPQGILGVPLVLRDKPAAVLYCDSSSEEVAPAAADAVEVLTLFAGKTIDLLSLGQKPPIGRTTAAGAASPGVAALRAERAPAPPAAAARPPARPPAPAPAASDEGASTVMFNPGQVAQMRQQAAAPPPAAPALAPEEQKAHEEAKRFARLVVSEIKLYNEAKVTEGRRHKDLYERLKEDIERGRQMYNERVPAHVRDRSNYFVEQLVSILAGGEPAALGPM